MNTYQLKPSQEAIKAASMVDKYLYWITNHSCQESFHSAFGDALGAHLWQKIVGLRTLYGSFGGDMRLWYELDSASKNKLMHYILTNKYKA